jgi:preprotein translocase subunit SecG
MIALVTTLHIIVCLFLIIVVLLQHGKSADIAATFGGQGSQTAFGPRGAATLLSRATTWSAVIFMVTSFALTVMVTKRSGMTGSAMQNEKAPQTQSPPAQTTPTPAQQQPANTPPPAPKQ